jgi:Ca-activated chloride channel homolog
VRALPSVIRVARRRIVAFAGLVALGVVAVGAAAVLASRPVAEQTIEPETRNRDVMLCLDVSGSMTDVDAEVVALFSRLAEDFAGERIGLTIFNSSPVRVFPLTDDYAFVRDQLDAMQESFESVEPVPEHWIGTLNGPGASLVGDGLAACALGFDSPDTERARSIILATDNEVNGAESITLDEAAAYAGSLDVRVFAIDPGVEDAATGLALRAAGERTGGGYFGLHDETTVDTVVSEVQKQDATVLRGQARIVRVDAPGPWPVVLAACGLAFVVVAWRVRA